MSKKVSKELTVIVTFEPARIQDSYFARAYEAVNPLIKCFSSEKINNLDSNYKQLENKE